MSTCRIALANIPFPASPDESVVPCRRRDRCRRREPRRSRLLSRVLRARLPRAEQARASLRRDVSRSRVAHDRGRRPARECRCRARHRAPRGRQTAHHDAGDQSRRNGRRLAGQGAAGSVGRGDLRGRPRTAGVHSGRRSPSVSRSATKDGAIPETVRYAARRGAQIVFIPHFHETEPGAFRPTTFGDPANTFHEKALLCRAAENTCFIAAVNYASEGSPTTSAIVRPDGTVLAWQPYGVAGLLTADLDLTEATGLLASRLKTFRLADHVTAYVSAERRARVPDRRESSCRRFLHRRSPSTHARCLAE